MGEGGFKGFSPFRFNTEALHEVICKTLKNKSKYKPYVERLYTKLYMKALCGALLRVINHRLVSNFSLVCAPMINML